MQEGHEASHQKGIAKVFHEVLGFWLEKGLKTASTPSHYIEFIDRIYILDMRNNIKRVEGNAGLILEQMPKKKPYETLMAGFFCRQ